MKTLRGIISIRPGVSRDRGAVAVIVGISLLMLMGFTALAVDAGMGYNQRRGTQNAADNAALAAAWEDCNPKSAASKDPAAAARATALENGYADADTTVEVLVQDLDAGQWQVDITTTDQTTFGRATPYAADSVTVISSAVAECKAIPFLGGYAVFAGGPPTCNGGAELDLTGSSKIINGGIHSNGEVKISGSETAIDGQVTYISDSNYEPSQQLFNQLDYPLDVTIADYRAGGARRNAHLPNEFFETSSLTANWLRTNGYAANVGGKLEMQQSGVYYTAGDVHINDDITMGDNVRVTWVSEGKIRFTGDVELHGFDPVVGGPNDPGIAIFANHQPPGQCTGQPAISLKGAHTTWIGVIFAPFGPVEPSFSSNVSLNGSIVGYTLNVAGANFEISWEDNPDAVPDFVVNLLK